MRSPSERLTYPQLERAVETFNEAVTRTRSMAPEPMGQQCQILVERDYARQFITLHARAASADGYTFAVPERIYWRQVQPGEVVRGEPLLLDERAARNLAEQLEEYNPRRRRMEQMEQQMGETRNELRSVANQLEEVRNHNNTLQRTQEEYERQIRWLERELRDANRERREAV